ncbi:glycine--tRNA ligase subunit beta [Pseudoteredinibacter isoporae]|uniref:glycine--tRNA ligase subunit beta n=1 Tax=Pseudoteredinibacter isoporae TaxID=570281 RepID=UPI00310B6718
MKKDFLVELGTEELPPKALKTLSDAFQQGIESGLNELELSFDSVKAYAAPRRLAVLVNGLDEQTPLKEVTVWGPPAKIAFDAEGNPSKAAEAFANKNGIAVDELKTENDGKQDKLVYRKKAGGEFTTGKLEAIVQNSLAKLPIAKRMRWGARRDEFVRPVQWLLMLFGNELVEAEVYGVKANRETRGHRFHYNQTLIIDQPSEYFEKLQSVAYVMADFEQRRDLIKQQVLAEAAKVNGEAMLDEDLLDEVTALVEWPVALTGKFEESFLEVPSEALVYSMKEHQKYFPIQQADGQLMPYFITISNIESKDPAQVISGNEKVIRPRLADAAFFFETDKKTSLSDMRKRLKPIVFQAQLGSIFDKTERIRNLSQMIVQQIDGDLAKCQRAAELCKSDLVSDMVGEFDKMQGVAGYYYAKHAGEDEEVALALQEQYLPKFAGDKLPSSTTGTIIALADRLDTLSGIFGIGQKPTGSKDPFALRRASVAVLRLLVEKALPLDLGQLLKLATINHGDNIKDSETSVNTALEYMLERFRAWYEEEKIAAEVFMAVSAKNLTVPLDINRRVHAVHAFSQLEDATALAAANKRVSNILAKLDSPVADEVNDTLLTEAAEQALAKAVAEKAEQVAPLFAAANYTEALSALADLRPVVDRFFDEVMVMADDMDLRNNRLALLNKLRQLFLQVADISLLAPAK